MKLQELHESEEEKSVLSVMGEPEEDPNKGGFDCSGRLLTSLEGCPQIVTGGLWCGNNKLKSLKGGPKEVGQQYSCSYNKLESLDGIAQTIGRTLICGENNLKSLQGIHKQIKFIGSTANFMGNPIESHVLGVLRIKGLKSVHIDNKKVKDILNKHLAGDKDIFACQEELIEAGFEAFAKL